MSEREGLKVCMCGHIRASHAVHSLHACNAIVILPNTVCPCTQFEER